MALDQRFAPSYDASVFTDPSYLISSQFSPTFPSAVYGATPPFSDDRQRVQRNLGSEAAAAAQRMGLTLGSSAFARLNSADTPSNSIAAFPTPANLSCSLYVKNLPPDTDRLFLYEHFAPFGAILSVKVLSAQDSNKCRGVGFVNFADHVSALQAIQALHGTKVADKVLHVSLQSPRVRSRLDQIA